jgi:hypothetical protein
MNTKSIDWKKIKNKKKEQNKSLPKSAEQI